ncbi:MAG: tRNA epoxyqueuosine(34) reductase QueG [Bacteroidales bacterium]|nr:tRNA epoxyqueuosine(34) reductase QueG [Bacteroidales bacterium]
MFSIALIKQLTAEVGFSDCGVAEAGALTDEEYPLVEWLDRGYQADMGYMERNADKRLDPRLLVEGAKSVISLVLAYKPDVSIESSVKIAQYAYGEDYHERMKRMMYQLIAKIKEQYPDFEGRPFVDTAPISDRHWAVRAGLGWIGRNTLFVHPIFGSYCFLGEIVTTAEIENTKLKIEDSGKGCGDCRLCVEACPNNAITVSKSGVPMLDARRCTSYNTIENRDDALPEELDTRGYAFGCDICQLVCPYNGQSPTSYHLDDERKTQLERLAGADEATFRRFAKHSALNRIKYPQWCRNLRKASEPRGGDRKTET